MEIFMKKKFLAVLLALVLVFALVPTAFASGSYQVLSLDKTSIKAGETVNLKVTLPQISGTAGSFTVDLRFDNSKLEVTKMNAPAALPLSDSSSTVSIMTNTKDLANENGQLAANAYHTYNIIDLSGATVIDVELTAKENVSGQAAFVFNIFQITKSVNGETVELVSLNELQALPVLTISSTSSGSGGNGGGSGSSEASGTGEGSGAVDTAGTETVDTAAGTETTLAFTDVPEGYFCYDAVKWAVEKNITTGTSATTFSPDAPCSRAQIVTFLWRTAGSPEPTGGSLSAFTDVDSSAYYAKAVAWAVENEITSGTSATTFSPGSTCTRAQAVTFLYRASAALNADATSESGAVSAATDTGFAGSAVTFTDVPSGAYFADAVAWAVENNVTNGVGGGLFGANNDCTRGHIVTFLYRCSL